MPEGKRPISALVYLYFQPFASTVRWLSSLLKFQTNQNLPICVARDHPVSHTAMCITQPDCCSWQNKVPTSSLELLQVNWIILILSRSYFGLILSCSSCNTSALVTHLLHLSTGISFLYAVTEHSGTHIIPSHRQFINLLLLTLVFLLNWANFSSWAASIFSKSWCFFSNSSTSDTESWIEKLSDMVVKNQVHQKRLCLNFSVLPILFSQLMILKFL